MPPKKKTWKNLKDSDSFTERRQMENGGKNTHDTGSKSEKNAGKITKMRFAQTNENETSKSLLLPSEPNVKSEHSGFWSKKLKDLEENVKSKKRGTYEFSGTDESDTTYKRRKKPRQKARLKKKKQSVIFKHNKLVDKGNKVPLQPRKKIKQIHMNSLCKEQIILSKERRKLDGKGKKFTFSIGMSTIGITSTPTVKKDNLVGASNFSFLSPIRKDEAESCNDVESPPVKSTVDIDDVTVTRLAQETPKVETKLKRISCRRVLRNGKMIIT